MFDLSFGELFLVLIAALLCIGPKEIPSAAKAAMSFFRSIRGVGQEIKSAFTEMVDESEPQMIKGDDGKMYESYETPSPLTQQKKND